MPRRRLELRLKRRGWRFSELRATADPDDHDHLVRLVVEELERNGHRAESLGQFSAEVINLDNPQVRFSLALS